MRQRKSSIEKRRIGSFTLLEILICLVIFGLASGAVYYNIHKLLVSSRFREDVGRLKILMAQTRVLALNTNADWELSLDWEKDKWKAAILCIDDPEMLSSFSSPAHFSDFGLSIDGIVRKKVAIQFFASGKVEPDGVVEISSGNGSLSRFSIQEICIPGSGTKEWPEKPK